MSPGFATLLLLVAPSVDLSLAGGVATTTSGGLTSVAQGLPAETALTFTLSPRGSLGLIWGPTRLDLTYSLRLLRRFELGEGASSLNELLPLHSVDLAARHDFSNSWSLGARSELQVGRVAVSSLLTPGGVDGGGGPGEPRDRAVPLALLNILTVNGLVSLGGPLSRDLGLRLAATTSYTRPLDEPAADPAMVLIPENVAFGVDGQLSYRLFRHTELLLNAAADFTTAPEGDDFQSVTAQVGVAQELSERTRGRARAGFIQIFSDTSDSTREPINGAQPAADLDLVVDLVRSRYFQMDGNASASLSGFANPATAELEPRIGGTLRVDARIHPTWTVDLSAGFGTPFSISGYTPRPDDELIIVIETVLSVDAGVGYVILPGLAVRAGVSFASFGPPVQDPNFRLQNNNISGLLSLDYSVSEVF